jgi:hypothetical protein
VECSEVRKLLSEAALGDLDAEPARRVAEHVKACDPCRAAQASLSSTVAALRGVADVVPSAERREAAVRAMSREHAVPPRRPRLVWAMAASIFILIAGAAAVLLSERGFDFRVANVSGGVERIGGAVVSAGDVLRPGDHLVTQKGGLILIDVGSGALHVGPDSSLDFVSSRKVVLVRGQLVVDLHATRDLVVSDTANNTLTLRSGRVEVGLHEVKAWYGGSLETKGQPPHLPPPREVVSQRLTARVVEGEADLDGSHRQRLRVVSGQEGRFNFEGTPSTQGWEKK